MGWLEKVATGVPKRLLPTKARVWVTFDRPGFHEGEDVVGRVSVESSEYVHAEEVRVEARVYEHYTELDDLILRSRVKKTRNRSDTRFSSDVRVSGPADFGIGIRNFPFTVNLPPYRPTHEAGSIEYNVKGVVVVKGRPDVTGETNVSFLPAALTEEPSWRRFVYGGQPPPPQALQATHVVTREIVKVRCRSCASLMDLSANRCPNCGASQ